MTGKVTYEEKDAMTFSYQYVRDDLSSKSADGTKLAWWNIYLSLVYVTSRRNGIDTTGNLYTELPSFDKKQGH